MTFWHHFRAYRSLEAECRDLASRLILAEDQVRLWRARSESAEGREQRTADNERRALKMIANAEALRTGSPIVPFPDVYVPMPEPEGEPFKPEPRRRQARDVVNESDAQFRAEYAAMLDKEIEQT